MPEWSDRAPWSCWWLWTVAKKRHSDGNRRFTVSLSKRTAGRILTELEQKGHCGSGTQGWLQLGSAKMPVQQKPFHLVFV